MKKIALSIFALSLTCNLFCKKTEEIDHRDKFIFGAKVGTNYSNVYNTNGESFVADAKFGLAFGAFMAIPLNEMVGIQPEFLFSRKGFQGSGALLGSNYSMTRTTTFIDVPVYLAIKPIPFITLLAGPQYSYLIKQKDVFTNSMTSYQQEQEFQNDNIRKNILGFSFGADFGIDQMLIGLRYGFDVQSNKGDGTSSTPNYKNVWYQATIGYRFL